MFTSFEFNRMFSYEMKVMLICAHAFDVSVRYHGKKCGS